MTKLRILEKDIQRQIIDVLSRDKRFYIYRNNTGGFLHTYKDRNNRMHRGFVHYGMKGSSDIIGLIGIDGRGIFLAIEVKRPGNVPSIHQHEFLKNVNDRGGIGIVVTSIEDLRHQLNEKGVII